MQLHLLIPDADSLLALEPEELAGVILQYLASSSAASSDFHAGNFTLPHNLQGYPAATHAQISQALMEAWVWLEREGLLAPRPGDTGKWVFVTRRGAKIASPEKLEAYRRASLLPKQMLHPVIAQQVWATFLRGDYDTAVFQSFKEVEVRTRSAANLLPTDLGVDLMRKAFKPAVGPLTDQSAPVAEQEALMHLMAGAVGSYKNPHSHRSVTIEGTEAVEMIILAGHLLGIIDKRRGV